MCSGEAGREEATMVQFRNEDEKGALSPKEKVSWAAVSYKPLAKALPLGDDNVYRLAALAAVAVGVAFIEVELLAGVALGVAAMAAPQFIKVLRSGARQVEKAIEEAGPAAEGSAAEPPSGDIASNDAAAAGSAEPAADMFHKTVTKVVGAAPGEPEELKQKLLRLGSELDRIKDSVPHDALGPLKAEVEKLAREATSEKRESALRSSGERIHDILKLSAELAGPAAKLIPEILAAVG
jgi:hypothetical protein